MTPLLALDSFKGCLTAPEAVDAVAAALAGCDVCRMPLSDGGEGFAECLVGCLGGTFRTVLVHDPLGRPVKARYALLEKGRTAVIETAAASGITLLKPEELDPLSASSIGTGELIQDAINQGVAEIWTGLGGTAFTNVQRTDERVYLAYEADGQEGVLVYDVARKSGKAISQTVEGLAFPLGVIYAGSNYFCCSAEELSRYLPPERLKGGEGLVMLRFAL